MRRQYFDALVVGDYESCTGLLDVLDRDCGFSLWSIGQRITLLSHSEGLEAQKKFSARIHETAPNSLATFYAYHHSRRAEPTINPLKFASDFLDLSSRWNLEEDFASYLNFLIAREMPSTHRAVADVLLYAQRTSLIDLYETFVQCAVFHFCHVEENPASAHFGYVLEQLAAVIPDKRLGRLLYIWRSTTAYLSPADFRSEPFIRCLFTGDLSEARRLCHDRRDVFGIIFRAILSAEDSVAAPQNDITAPLAIERSITQLYKKDRLGDDIYLDLLRLIEPISGSEPYAYITNVADDQMTSQPQLPTASWKEQFVTVNTLDTSLLRFPPLDRRDFVEGLIKFLQSSASAHAHVLTESSQNFANLTPSHDRDLRIMHALAEDDLDSVLSLTASATVEEFPYLRRRRLRARAVALLKSNLLLEALGLIIDTCIADAGSIRMVPLSECVDCLDKKTLKNLRSHIEVPIIFDLYTRHEDDKYGDLRGYAYEDFLIAHGLERPSQIDPMTISLEMSYAIYYLRHVCVPEVMQVSTAFQSSRELEEERIAVCGILERLDPANYEVYETEIRTITRRQVIQGGVRQIEQSKISIDADPLKRWADRNLSDGFNRFRSLIAAGIVPDAESIRSVLQGHHLAVQNALTDIPLNEASHLLVQIVSIFVDQCFTHAYHGLDCYLSMRVRHGVLAGQMRAPLEDEHLITQKRAGTIQYARNEYWFEQISQIDFRLAVKVDEQLRRFSAEYDAFIADFVDSRMQIQSDDKPDGLFDSRVSEESILSLSNVAGANSFDTFVDQMIEVFWGVVEDDLAKVREYIGFGLTPRLNEIFTKLLKQIEETTRGHETHELNNSIRVSQTKAQNALEATKDWFKTSQIVTPVSFSFEELVHIGLEQVKKLWREFNPTLDLTTAELPSFSQLVRFSDIFYLIFGNIARHSGMKNPNVNVCATLEEASLLIDVKSQVADGVYSNHIEDHVRRIREKIESGEELTASRLEGGTGLMKLRSRLGTLTPQPLQFGFEGPNAFVVRMTVPLSAG